MIFLLALLDIDVIVKCHTAKRIMSGRQCFVTLLPPEILVAPESRVVYLDQSAVFTCKTFGGTPVWVVNGTQREVHPADIRRDLVVSETIIDDGSTLETLTIPAGANYNGTTVQCAVLTFGGLVRSESATMSVQGSFVHCVRFTIMCVFLFLLLLVGH